LQIELKIFFYLQNQKLIFSFNFPFNLAAERSEAAQKSLTFPKWWTILKLARTISAPSLRSGRRKNPKNLTARRVLQKLPKNRKNIVSNYIL